MYRLLIVNFAMLTITGCSTPPSPRLPDGATRVPVNHDDAVARFRAQQTRSAVTPPQPDQQRIAALEQQLATLRQQLAAPAPAAQPDNSMLASTPLVVDGAEIDYHDQWLHIRIPQPSGQAQFAPSTTLAQLLRQAAARSTHIEIIGHTDADRPDLANKRLAQLRSRLAYQYLAEAGTPTSRLHMNFRASGGFIADNTTLQGQARNRRVDIQMRGFSASEVRQLLIAHDRSTP